MEFYQTQGETRREVLTSDMHVFIFCCIRKQLPFFTAIPIITKPNQHYIFHLHDNLSLTLQLYIMRTNELSVASEATECNWSSAGDPYHNILSLADIKKDKFGPLLDQ